VRKITRGSDLAREGSGGEGVGLFLDAGPWQRRITGQQLKRYDGKGPLVMSSDWEQQYLAAIFDEEAERSIKSRMRELMSEEAHTTAGELTKLSDALRVVRDLLDR
jgi:hypothetical protein